MDGPCAATTKAGRPCSVPRLPGDAYCWAHSPRFSEARAAGAVKGGSNRSNAARARTALPPGLRDVESLLYQALAGVANGSIEPKVGVALASIARALVAVSSAGDLEARLLALESEDKRATA